MGMTMCVLEKGEYSLLFMKIDGKKIAKEIFEDLQKRVGELKKNGFTPHLAIILVGNDPASVAYVRQKEKKTLEIGGKVVIKNLPTTISQNELLIIIKQFNNDNNVHGIIVQRPLPKHIDSQKVNLATSAQKDIDAFHPNSPFQMPLAQAVLKILEEIHTSLYDIKANKGAGNKIFDSREESTSPLQYSKDAHNATKQPTTFRDRRQENFVTKPELNNWLKSKNIAIIGKGETGGGPTITLLKKMGIKPVVIDSKTKNPKLLTKNADIIISTVGKENIITSDMLKKGVILISVGMHKGSDGKLHGDYEEEKIKDIASFYTPVPGGVGPINVAMLLKNLTLFL